MTALLRVEGVSAGYGRVEVLRSFDVVVPEGAVVAVLGPNGAGKTTLLRAITGTLPVRRGQILLAGERIDGLAPHVIAKRGVLLVPEGRGVFPGLTVADNLEIAVRAGPDLSGDGRRM